MCSRNTVESCTWSQKLRAGWKLRALGKLHMGIKRADQMPYFPVVEGNYFRRLKWLSHQNHSQLSDFECTLHSSTHSRWTLDGLQMDTTYNTIKATYFMIIHLESIWSLHRLCRDSTSVWTPPDFRWPTLILDCLKGSNWSTKFKFSFKKKTFTPILYITPL